LELFEFGGTGSANAKMRLHALAIGRRQLVIQIGGQKLNVAVAGHLVLLA
jgi:hypothetical protein